MQPRRYWYYYSPTSIIRTNWDYKKHSDNRGFGYSRLWIVKYIHDNFDYSWFIILWCWTGNNYVRVNSVQYNIYCVCSRIGQQKKLVPWRCITFVDHRIAVLCCSLWTSCQETGLQSFCASNHRKLVNKAVCLAVGRHGRRDSDAIVMFHIALTIW